MRGTNNLKRSKVKLIYAIIGMVLGIGALIWVMDMLNKATVPTETGNALPSWIPLAFAGLVLVGIFVGFAGHNWNWFKKLDKFMHGKLMTWVITGLLVATVVINIFCK
jgi:FtsH-binding integral membrane protein